MIGLSKEVYIPENKIRMPIYFDRKNVCVHCGGEGTLIFINRFGRATKDEITAFDHIECKKCGKKYSIKWTKDPDSPKMYPSAVDTDVKDNFAKMINAKNAD